VEYSQQWGQNGVQFGTPLVADYLCGIQRLGVVPEDVEIKLEDIYQGFPRHFRATEQAGQKQIKLAANNIDNGVPVALLVYQ
jgi:hypothetical protein